MFLTWVRQKGLMAACLYSRILLYLVSLFVCVWTLWLTSGQLPRRGRDAEKVSGNMRGRREGLWKKNDMKTAVEKKIKCLCERAGAFLGNYDSSGMSPELSAKREIKKGVVSGPTASQSDSHENNIGGICCNLGIIYPPPQPKERKTALWRLKSRRKGLC